MTDKQTIIAREIIHAHDGQMLYSLKEIGKIIGKHPDNVAGLLHKNGITIKTNGRTKEADAYDIAEYICKDRTAPVS